MAVIEDESRFLLKALHRVTEGEEIVISKSGKPVHRLVPIQDSPKRLIGLDDSGTFRQDSRRDI